MMSNFNNMMSNRSTKGASKTRRENINSEINKIRDCLPIPDAIRKRLSQLQVMALCKAFIGKSNSFSKLNQCEPFFDGIYKEFEFTQALPGFLLMTTTSGRILYISENVMEFLGHSMVDILTQSESIHDLIDFNDRHILEKIFGSAEQCSENSTLLQETGTSSSSLDEKLISFSCRMGMLRHARRNPNFDRYKKIRVSGRFVQIAGSDPSDSSDCVFVALCTSQLNQVMASEPSLIFDTMAFQSVHRLDMKFISLDHNGQFHLGYRQDEMVSRSWYELIHPDDESKAAAKHRELLQATSADAMYSLCIRVQASNGSFVWVQTIMQRSVWSNAGNLDEPCIVCVSQVISEMEASAYEKKEEQMLISPGNFNGGYKMELVGSAGSLPAVIPDEVFCVEEKPDRAEVLRRLKRKMTASGSDKKNKLPCYSNPPPAAVSVVSGFSDEMVSPFPSGTSYASSTTDSQGDFFYSSEEESIFYSAMMNPVVKTNLEVPAVTYINGTAPSPNFIIMPDPSPAPSKQMPAPMYQTAFNFTTDATEFMGWSMPTPEQQMGGSPAPSRCSDGSPAPSRFSGSSPAPSRCSDGSPAPARCHDDQAYYVAYAEENFDVSFFSPPALKIKEESEMKLKSQIGGNQDMCDLPVLDTIFLSKFFDSLD